jgi:hypothetical protein
VVSRTSVNARLIMSVIAGYAVSAIPGIFLVRYTTRPRLDFLIVATLYGMLFAFVGGLLARKISHGDRRAGVYLATAIAAAALLALLFQRDNVGVLPMLTTLVFMAPLALGKPGFNALRR